MVRRGSSCWGLVALVATAIALGSCSDDDGDTAGGEGGSAPGDTGGAVTVPDDADEGIGYLVLDEERTLLFVRACELEPVLDPATGVTTELAIDLDDEISRAVSLTRYSFGGDLDTTTDEILIADDEAIALDATRVDRSGTLLDLRAPGVLEPLLEIDGSLVRARGVFGPPGSREGDPGLVEGSLILRCP